MHYPVPASDHDALPIWQLRRQREQWLSSRGIDQWPVGEVPIATIQEQVDRTEWHVLRDEGVIAGLRILWADPDFWGPDDGHSIYVHGLMVDLQRAGEGLGSEMLDWATDLGKRHGKTRLRLDSAITNPGLTHYYERLGFVRRGQHKVGNLFEVILWERAIPLDSMG